MTGLAKPQTNASLLLGIRMADRGFNAEAPIFLTFKYCFLKFLFHANKINFYVLNTFNMENFNYI